MLIQRLNNRGNIVLEERVGIINGLNIEALIDSFQQNCIELIGRIRVQRKGQVLDPIEFAKKYISDNLTEKISLDDVADKLGLNSAYFSHLFKKETGTSFVEYRMQLRMEKAMKLIDSSNMKITEIANSLGYEISHITRKHLKSIPVYLLQNIFHRWRWINEILVSSFKLISKIAYLFFR